MGTFLRALSTLADGLAILGGLGCLAAAAMAQGGRVSVRFDVLTHFAPVWLLGALLVLIYGLTLSAPAAKVVTASLGGLGVIAAAALIVPEFTRPMSPKAPADAPGQIKLIQFNGWARNRDPKGGARWILDQNPDFIVMEEPGQIREELIKSGRYYGVCPSCGVVIFARSAPVRTGLPLGMSKKRGVRPPIVRATFRDARGEFTIMGTHYVWPAFAGVQQAQGRVLAKLINETPNDRLILAGDFNSTPWSFSRQTEDALFGMERRTRGLLTWPAQKPTELPLPSPLPFLAIDHVYAGRGWRTVKVELGPRLGSDHYPVVVVLAPTPVDE